MDENNKNLSAEEEKVSLQTEDESEVITETAEPEAPADSAEAETSSFADEISELGIEPSENTQAASEASFAAVKKFPVQVPIVIAAVIVACAALFLLVFKCFFNTSIVGSWTINNTSTSDEASSDDTALTYYVFNDDETVTLGIGTMDYKGTYSITESDDGTKSVEMYIPYAYLQATFEYTVSGNIFSGRQLTFNYNDEVTYTFSEKSRVSPKLEVSDDFEADEVLVGEWNYYYDGYYDYTYTFGADGKVNVNQNDYLVLDGTYTISDGVITVTYYADREYTQDLEYSVDGDELILQGIRYLRVGSASADEARQSAESSD